MSYVLPKAAQNMYAPFTKNRREIVMILKNDRLGFISFEKAFRLWNYLDEKTRWATKVGVLRDSHNSDCIFFE
jgi:hypothetical protein